MVVIFYGSCRLSVSASRCMDRACSPPVGNLASGRTLLTRSSRCHRPPADPHLCPEDPHPPAHMADDPFLNPDTWWESGGGPGAPEQQDEIRLDLDTRFCLSHVIVVFRSPRPAAMAVERSADFGETWEALKLFARNCSAEFGLPDDSSQPGSVCTSRYSGAAPCTRGEVSSARCYTALGVNQLDNHVCFCSTSQVILRTLDPSSAETLDPYSPEALARLTLTNVRIRLLRPQACAADVHTGSTTSSPTSTSTQDPATSAPYAIYTLLARGTCLCHGHAEYCGALNSSRDSNVVGGFFFFSFPPFVKKVSVHGIL